MNIAIAHMEKMREAERLMADTCRDTDGVYGMLLCTSDGQAQATYIERQEQGGRLSAMSSSLLALAETIARETRQQQCRYVILDNTDGFVVSLRVDSRLTLTCLGNQRINLGMLLSTSKMTAERLQQLIHQ
ncbi:roadblock/LC7 domain-containing protein [Isoalcanivorax beigongshangi]|uniref:Roadblock/LC7 domain-containing protein n=1 Tax=Isoalcanivorax beigongshangi TaxID=3238810 RepID=A0ABV4AD88_9GAMM